MCQIIIINKGEKEISTPRQFLEHFKFLPISNEYLGAKLEMNDCLCQCDIDLTFNNAMVKYKEICGDYYVGMLNELNDL